MALFLMRCIFCMFACSVGLLPESGLVQLLDRSLENPASFRPLIGELWRKMNDPEREGRYYPGLDIHLPFVGGSLFRQARVIDLQRDALQALRNAAKRSWAHVEPAIFGALLEGALSKAERRKLGAHYTPRTHVERLVRMTVIEPLRREWRQTLAMIERARDAGAPERAQRWARNFHARLRQVRVLDPACGTGNFLYIALELMKALEAEVLETLAQLGAPELLQLEVVDPRQFLGLELNPRAAVIAELVLWIGFLQLHYRTHSGHPAEPILRAYGTIRHADAVLEWDGWPLLQAVPVAGAHAETLPDPRQPQWPEAEFIVGNPPFLGGKDLRTRLGDLYAEALWAAHPQMKRSADLVMYWWDHAAELLTREATVLRRFGLVTTNSLSQAFQRQTLERRLAAGRPVRLVYAVPDHPWTSTADAAAVRVALTVAEAGAGTGVRLELVREAALDSDEPHLEFRRTFGRIHSDLSIGADLTAATPLLANRGLCSPGVKLHGAGFIVSLGQARALGLGRRPGLEDYIRPYRNGRDIVQQGRDAWVIDLYPLPAEVVRLRFPEVYQHLLATVKPHRDANRMAFRREHWWWFGATHEMYRSFTAGLERYICTPETAKHRIFVFLPQHVRADNMLVSFGLSDGFHLGVLSSRPHRAWAKATGAVLEDRPRYTKSACFDPFPFPDAEASMRAEIAAVAEELHATRNAVQAEHPDLSLTAVYNGMADGGSPDLERRGRLAILRELHARLDQLALQAYGWPESISRTELLAGLTQLNQHRRAEEASHHVRWLRPDYQARRYDRAGEAASRLQLARAAPEAEPRPLFPRDRDEQSAAVLQALVTSGAPLQLEELLTAFRNGPPRMEAQIKAALAILVQYGHLARLPDGRYLMRRAA